MPDTPLPHASPELLNKAAECLRWIDFILNARDACTWKRDGYKCQLGEAFTYVNKAETLGHDGEFRRLGREIQEVIAVDPQIFAYQNSADFTFTPHSRASIQPHIHPYVRPVYTINVLTREIVTWLLRVIELFTAWADLLSGVALIHELYGSHYYLICVMKEDSGNRDDYYVDMFDYFLESVVPLLLKHLELFTWPAPQYSYESNITMINAIIGLANAREQMSAMLKRKLGIAFYFAVGILEDGSSPAEIFAYYGYHVLSAIATPSRVYNRPPGERFISAHIALDDYVRPFDIFTMINITVYRWFDNVLLLFACWADMLNGIPLGSYPPEQVGFSYEVRRLDNIENYYRRNRELLMQRIIPTINRAIFAEEESAASP